MFGLKYLAEHAIDKEISVIQQIMSVLENNNVNYQEWERILSILSPLVDERIGNK